MLQPIAAGMQQPVHKVATTLDLHAIYYFSWPCNKHLARLLQGSFNRGTVSIAQLLHHCHNLETRLLQPQYTTLLLAWYYLVTSLAFLHGNIRCVQSLYPLWLPTMVRTYKWGSPGTLCHRVVMYRCIRSSACVAQLMHIICDNSIWITYLAVEEPSQVGENSEFYTHCYGES